MVNVAREMDRRGMELPLLIGGATTSRQHTAVKIAPEYDPPVVHVVDAARVVGVVSGPSSSAERGLSSTARAGAEQERLRALHAERGRSPCSPYRVALERRTPIAWRDEDLAELFLGTRTVEPAIAQLRPYIDWTFFFTAWELKGRYPGDPLDHPARAAARELLAHAPELLDELERDGSLSARGCVRLLARVGRGSGRIDCCRTASGSRCSANRRTTATSARLAPGLRRPPTPAWSTTSAPSRSRPASAPPRSSSGSRPSTTTTARSW